MTTLQECGPRVVVDGPPPFPPRYGLLMAGSALVPGVRFVTPGAGPERWLNGVKAEPFPHHGGATWSQFDASGPSTKEVGDPEDELDFWPVTVYASDTCRSYRIDDDDEYRSRIELNLAAVESAVVANALLTGDGWPPAAPRLSDGGGEFPNANTAVSLPIALSLLEGAIARGRHGGVIHMSPIAASVLSGTGHVILSDPLDTKGQNVMATRLGTLVIPDQGYVDGATPAPSPGSHPAASSTQEWIYASGPIDVYRSTTFINPPELSQALNRSANTVTYQAERNYLVSWDNSIQAAVLANRT